MAKSAEKHPLEVKIGVQFSARELSLDVDLSPAEIAAAVDKAVADGGALQLTDIRGRQVIVPADKLTYVEVGAPETRRVGFGAT